LLSSIALPQKSGKTWVWQRGADRFEILRTGISEVAVAESLRQFQGSRQKISSLQSKGTRASSQELDDRNTGGAPDFVIVFGLAGALHPSVAAGTLVIPQSWRSEGHADALTCSDRLARKASHTAVEDPAVLVGGAGVTLLQPALSPEERCEVVRKFPDALICDMETYFVLRHFQRESVSIRVVSDDVIEPQRTNFKLLSSALAQFVFRFLMTLSDER